MVPNFIFEKLMKMHFLYISCFLFFGCTNNNSTKYLSENELITIEIPKETKNNLTFVKSARFVFLDNAIPIGRIEKLIITKTNIIVQDKIAEDIKVYDLHGKYLKRINHKGKGPGEYSEIKDIAYDERNTSLAVLNIKKIILYSLDNDLFIKEIH